MIEAAQPRRWNGLASKVLLYIDDNKHHCFDRLWPGKLVKLFQDTTCLKKQGRGWMLWASFEFWFARNACFIYIIYLDSVFRCYCIYCYSNSKEPFHSLKQKAFDKQTVPPFAAQQAPRWLCIMPAPCMAVVKIFPLGREQAPRKKGQPLGNEWSEITGNLRWLAIQVVEVQKDMLQNEMPCLNPCSFHSWKWPIFTVWICLKDPGWHDNIKDQQLRLCRSLESWKPHSRTS